MATIDWGTGTDSGEGSSKKKGALDWGTGESEGSAAAPDDTGGGFLSGIQQTIGERLEADPVNRFGKGAARLLIDFVSRGNYAAAGAAEELFTREGRGPAAAAKRAGREILSGLPFTDIKGDKESFAQVMEQAGVGELGKLSDVLPIFREAGFPKAGGALDITGRGFTGFLGDVFLDPTTYITYGGAAARRVMTGTGAKYLSKSGKATLRSIETRLQPAYEAAVKSAADDTARVVARREIVKLRGDLLDEAIAKNPKLLDPTGIKWFGQEVVSDRALRGLSDTAKKVVLSVPGGDWAARQVQAPFDYLQRVFDPYAQLAGVAPDVRQGMKAVIQENRSAAAMHKSNLLEQWSELERDYAREARKYGGGDAGKQELGKKFSDWREQTGTPKLTQAESDLFGKIARMYDDSEAVVLREGLITPEQAATYSGRYLHHEYKNPEVLLETAKRSGRPVGAPIATEQFQRERPFATYQEAVEKSKELAAETRAYREAGGKGKLYGSLEPEYDAMKNLGSYIQQTTDAVWRGRTFREAREKYGLALDDFFDPSRTYELNATRQVPKADREIIEEALKSDKPDFAQIARQLPKMTADGQKEMARELVAAAKSPSQIVNIREALDPGLMPDARTVKPGDVEPYFTKYGQDGTLVSRQGGLWGDKEILIPQQVADIVENAPRDFVMDSARQYKLQGMLKAYDWYNNMFKGITYPFWPAGAFRDAYNNVMQSFLGIGVGGFARPFQAGRILAGGDGALKIGAHEFKASEWKRLAQDLGVTDPSGAAFAQFTGEEGVKRATLLSRARAKRASIDNASRVQLWINNVAAGMPPEDAARVVKEFLFDYGELSPVDQYAMKRAIPFYVFPRKAIESYGRAVVKTPGRVANLAKPFRGREDENNSLTTWEGEGFKVRLERDGKTLTMLNGVDIPVRTLDTLWRGDPKKTLESLLSMASPAIKVPYEYVSGRDPFRGQPFQRQQSYVAGPLLEKLPKAVQIWAGYQKTYDEAGRPKYTVNQGKIQMLVEATLLSRILSTSERAFREQVREPNRAARWLDFLTGLRLKTLNLDEEQQKKVERMEREAQERAVQQGEMKEFRKVYK